MYYPYLRGKQFELLLLRENAKFIKENNIHPIIEPVKENFASLKRALNILNQCQVGYILIVNPQVGELEGKSNILLDNLYNEFIEPFDELIHIGFIITANTRLIDIDRFLKKYDGNKISLIHYGFTKGKDLASLLKVYSHVKKHIFIEDYCGKLYQKHLNNPNVNKILIRDGFKKQMKNKLYPETEHFSDIHATFKEESVNGFGDFLIVGDQYFDGGGKLYTLVIHITFIDEDDMYIYHFISGSSPSEKQENKFLTAVNKFYNSINRSGNKIFKSNACKKFLDLREQGHYPGLGTIKKLSMQHHIELVVEYLSHERD